MLHDSLFSLVIFYRSWKFYKSRERRDFYVEKSLIAVYYGYSISYNWCNYCFCGRNECSMALYDYLYVYSHRIRHNRDLLQHNYLPKHNNKNRDNSNITGKRWKSVADIAYVDKDSKRFRLQLCKYPNTLFGQHLQS